MSVVNRKFRKLALVPRYGVPRKITDTAEKWFSETIQSLSEAKYQTK